MASRSREAKHPTTAFCGDRRVAHRDGLDSVDHKRRKRMISKLGIMGKRDAPTSISHPAGWRIPFWHAVRIAFGQPYGLEHAMSPLEDS
jgi:hypothetical protein